MAATLGNDIIVLADSKVICGTKTNDIQCDAELVNVSSSSDGAWVHRVVGRKEWSVTVSFLLVNVASDTTHQSVSIGNLLSVGSSYTLRIKPRNGLASDSLQGSAFLKSMKVTGTRGNLATGSWQFVGNGPLTVPTT